MKKPNFIIIYCDDLGYGDLGCYGSEHVKTPNLDRLAENGVRFTDWYSNSPVCSPSRASLLTGMYPARTGVSEILGGNRGASGLPEDKSTLAKLLRARGYATAMYGKWHLGMAENHSPNAHGFDEFFGFKAGCIDYYSHIFYWGQAGGVQPVHDLWHNGEEVWENGRYMTELITDHAIRFVERNTSHPFFLYLPYNAPHYPMHAPDKYMDRYSHLPWKKQIMAAMISAVDDGVGEIVAALKQNGIYENTMIFFSSDNGPSVEIRNWLDGTGIPYDGGSAGIFRGHKGSLFEGGIREPAILSYPAVIPGGQVCREVGVMMDVLPTILDFAGIDVRDCGLPVGSLDGKSVAGMATNGQPSPHDKVYWEYHGQLAVRNGDWKLVLDGMLDFDRASADPVHLSDVSRDPAEKENLASRYPEVAQELIEDVRTWHDNLRADHAK